MPEYKIIEERDSITIKVSSPYSGTKVYLNEVFFGMVPITQKLPYGKKIKIRCALEGYEDYLYTYPSVQYDPNVPLNTITWSCIMTAKKASQGQPAPTKSGETKILEEKQSPTAPSDISQTPQKPQGFFNKVQNAVSSFFSKIFSIFSRRQSSPVIIPTSVNELQGMWKIEKLYSGVTERELKEMTLEPAQMKYTEFRSDKVCIDGSFNTDGEPIPCTNYSTLTVSGNKLSFPQPNGIVVNGTWAITNGKLELNLTITQGSKTMKFRAIYAKFDKPFSTQSAPKAVPAVPLQSAPKAVPIQPIQPQTPLTSVKGPTVQELQGIWIGTTAGGYGDAYYVEFRGNDFCPYGITAGPDIVACSASAPTVSGYVMFALSSGEIHFTFRGQNFIWQVTVDGNKLTVTKNGYDIQEGFEGRLKVKTLSVSKKEAFTKYK